MRLLFLLLGGLAILATPRFLHAQCGTSPTSGLVTLSGAGQVPNSYYPGTGNPLIGQTSLVVGAIDSRGNATALAAGDLVLIIQMQGADLNSTNSDSYGDGVAGVPATGELATNLYAGHYEYNTVSSVSGTTVNFSYSLANNYYTRAYTTTTGIRTYQVIRVPRYYNLTIDAGATVTAPAWNGSTGGVVVLDAVNVLTLNGSVDVSARGFRGGGGKQFGGAAAGNSNGSTTLLNTDYRFNSAVTNTANLTGGAKGEGIAGRAAYTWIEGAITTTTEPDEGYVDGSMGRGAPANAGGGGTDGDPLGSNQYNTGGGGGGNGGAGGNGGSGWHGAIGNVNTYPYGGNGGSVFQAHSMHRLIMGGGGGAGTANNSTAVTEYQSSGGAGGGIIIARAGSYAGNGSFIANGGAAHGINGTPTTNTDAAGGGGAGGSIVVVTRQAGPTGMNTLTASATGGVGGNMANYYDHGPGGGGGGGIIYTNGSFASAAVTGGLNGRTRAGSAAGALTNDFGSTPGAAGQLITLSSVPGMTNLNDPASPCGVLPVTLVSLKGLIVDGAVSISWEIADAYNLHHFDVEYSTNGVNFSTAGSQEYTVATHYNFTHRPDLPALLYYRIKMVDIDGSFSYSKVITLRTNRQGNDLLLYPNPAKDVFTLQVRVDNTHQAVIRTIDVSGTQVNTKNTVLQKGDNVIGMDTYGLPAGTYVIEIRLSQGQVLRKRLQVIR